MSQGAPVGKATVIDGMMAPHRPDVLTVRVKIIQGRFVPGPARLTSPSGQARGILVLGAPQVNPVALDATAAGIILLDVRGVHAEELEAGSTLSQGESDVARET